MNQLLKLFSLFLALSCSQKDKQVELKTTKETTPKKELKTEIKSNKLDKNLNLKFIKSIPHNKNSYTQGLFYFDGYLYESAGQYLKSTLNKIDPNTGETIYSSKLPANIFAEGITKVDDKIYLLTWREQTAYVYNINTFSEISKFFYLGEGWGLTSDSDYLYMSDGGFKIYKRDRNTFEIVSELQIVNDKGIPVDNINEMEIIENEIFANIYMTDYIIRVNAENGTFIGFIDLSFLRNELKDNPEAEVLNGIAFNNKENLFYFTGKYWNKIFIFKLE